MHKILILLAVWPLLLFGCGRTTPDSLGHPGVGQAPKAPTCLYVLVPTDVLAQPEGNVEVATYTSSDLPDQSWVSVAFNLHDAKMRLSEGEVNGLIKRLSDRLSDSCRMHALQKSRIFLYPAGVSAGQSDNWIARYDSETKPAITLRHNLLKDERKDKYACIDKPGYGRGIDTNPKLPQVRQRKILGTWASPTFGLTFSLEQVGGHVYRVRRDAYCQSGERGERLRTGPGQRFSVIGSNSGDYYAVMPSGELGVFDRDGQIDTWPTHAALHPIATGDD